MTRQPTQPKVSVLTAATSRFLMLLDTFLRQKKEAPLVVSLTCLGIIGTVSTLISGIVLQSWTKAEHRSLTQAVEQSVAIVQSYTSDVSLSNNAAQITTLGKKYNLLLQAYPASQVPPRLATTYQLLKQSSDSTVTIAMPNWSIASGYTLLRNPQKAPVALLEVQQPRELFWEGLKSIVLLNLLTGTSGVLFCLGLRTFLHRTTQILTQEEQISQFLLQEKEFALITLQSIQEAVITTDAGGKIKMLNPMAEKLTGWTSESAVGLPLGDVFSIEDDDSALFVKLPLAQVMAEGVSLSGTQGSHSLISRDGKRTSIDYSLTRIWDKDSSVQGVVVVFRDVTTHREMARLLAWRANFDALTGLVNRREFERRLEDAVQQATVHQAEHSLCFIDLDYFKTVNDTAGHPAGDELLRQISTLIRQYFRRSDLVARLGGDEFGAILYHCSLAEAEAIAKEVCHRVNNYRFVWQEQVFKIGASIGLVPISADSTESNQLFNLVDAACYAAKNQGRGRVCIYQPSMEELTKQRSEARLIQRINQALSEDQFCLYSQVITPLQNHLRGGEFYEVLLRMFDDEGKLVLPNAFLPAAERYNLMPTIDRWVISKLFSTQAHRYQQSWQRWQSEGIESSYMINLSAASVTDNDFTKFLVEQIKLHNIPAPLVCFEVKETVAVANLSRLHQFVTSLKSIGCRFALDDFGSGMSSFAYLKNLPIDYLKIDGSLIRDIDNPSTFATIEAINRISSVMEMKTIAEFVTSAGIAKRCAAAGINYAQGYGIGRPKLLTGPVNPARLLEPVNSSM